MKDMPAPVLVVTKQIKDYLKSEGCSMGGDIPAAISRRVQRILDEAIVRAKMNRRRVVKSVDL